MGVVALTATPFSCRMRVNKDEWICRNRRFHACREERGCDVHLLTAMEGPSKAPVPDGTGALLLCSLPQQQTVLKRGADPPGVFQPGEVRTHRAAYQNILLEIHVQSVVPEQFLQDALKG